MYRNGELNLSEKIQEIFYKLVSIRSDTGTSLERDVEEYIYNWIGNIEYFRKNPDKFGSHRIENDHLGRSVVWGLVKGKGENTVIFIHHHDVVDSFDYGVLSKHAYTPDVLEKALKDVELTDEARKDLENGQWIFGRGTADMKAGAAIQLALLEKYSKLENFNGNILLISVPDEESLSVGMREAVNLLNQIKEKFNLKYTLLINSEPHDREIENTGLYFDGSAGKIMPVIYIRGKKAHVGYAFQGFNPVGLLSEIVRRIELNPDFCDVVGNEISPPPSWVYFRDRKECYDASIPQSVGGYINILTLKGTPKDILERIVKISEEAFEEVIERVNNSYLRYNEKIGRNADKLPWKVNVRIFSDIYKEALENSGDAFLKDYNSTMDKLKEEIQKGEIDIPQSNFVLIEKVLEYIKDLSPMVVIAFSPPYYPPVTNGFLKGLPDSIKNLDRKINQFTLENYSERYEKCSYFMGISDMSYAALTNSDEVIPYLGPNMPLWGNMYDIPLEKMEKLSIPVINIGPWGKDLHKFTERVLKRDLLERTPKLIEHVIKYILNGD